MYPDVDMAIDEIVNETVCIGEENDVIKIDLDDVKLTPSTKKVIEDEFKGALRMLKFNKFGYDVFRKWYVDGRLYFHVIVDQDNLQDGIKELRYIDPRKIRKVKEVTKKRLDGSPGIGIADASITYIVNEYFIYNEKGFGAQGAVGNSNYSPSQGLKIAVDSIIHITSGVMDGTGSIVLSHLHKSIKPLNQLKELEDSTVIYRLVRAPERRVWKIDVGNLPKQKADQYMRDIQTKYKNRVVYDSTTGEVRDDRKHLTMLEDIWIPTRGGGQGNDVDTLPAGELTGVLDDVLYFQKKLFNSLNVPVSRLNSDNIFTSGRATEITRDEVKFAKFVYKLRAKFSDLFLEILQRQLIFKNIIANYDEWREISNDIRFDYVSDNYFAALKDMDVLQDRLNILTSIDMFAGKYYSHEWIRKNVLGQTDADIEVIDAEIEEEKDDPQYALPPGMDGMMPPGEDGMGGGMPPVFGSPPESDDGSDDGNDGSNSGPPQKPNPVKNQNK